MHRLIEDQPIFQMRLLWCGDDVHAINLPAPQRLMISSGNGE
jgi:hypothetical protein